MEKRILLVDDDEELRQELRDFLDSYGVAEASSGEEALQLMRKANSIDLVILDVMMPGKNGLEVLKEIKKSDPAVKIVILTGHSSKDVAVEALKGHADDYIEKPVIEERIKNTVERLLESVDGKSGVSRSDSIGKIEKVKHFVIRNCYKKTTLEDAAGAVFLSPKYLSRIFKEQARMSFSAYRLKIKMEKAKKLLTRYGYNVNQASEKLGYENAESFIRQFKKITKLTPMAYRKKVLNGRVPKTSKRRIKKPARKTAR